MPESNIKSAGVYFNEVNAFPNSVVPVASAVPAFIGYTPQAICQGKSYFNIPIKISSFSDFQAFYCYPDPPAPADPAKQYNPQHYLVAQEAEPAGKDYLVIKWYLLLACTRCKYHILFIQQRTPVL